MKCDICGADYFKGADVDIHHIDGEIETANVSRIEISGYGDEPDRTYNLCPICLRTCILAGEIYRRLKINNSHVWPAIEKEENDGSGC